MRSKTILSSTLFGLILVGYGCTSGSGRGIKGRVDQPKRTKTWAPYTAQNNPTKRDRHQDPDPTLQDEFLPAAWVLIDGMEGTFIEIDGNPQLQWIVEEPVSSSPTFRVEAFEPVMGSPTVFRCALRTDEAVDGSSVTYGIASQDGEFQVGREYSLVSPGSGFVIRTATGDIVDGIGPLAPGRYFLAASVNNPESEKTALAVTSFTVGQTE